MNTKDDVSVSTDAQALISLHIWAAVSSYEVLGDFGGCPSRLLSRAN